MRWYLFELKGLPEPVHQSLTRMFARLSQRESPPGKSRLFSASEEPGALPAIYYLAAADDYLYARLLRQFGGRECVPPNLSRVKEIKQEGEPADPTPEPDSSGC